MLFVKNFRIFFVHGLVYKIHGLVRTIPMLGTETALEYYFKIKLRHIKIPLVSSFAIKGDIQCAVRNVFLLNIYAPLG